MMKQRNQTLEPERRPKTFCVGEWDGRIKGFGRGFEKEDFDFRPDVFKLPIRHQMEK